MLNSYTLLKKKIEKNTFEFGFYNFLNFDVIDGLYNQIDYFSLLNYVFSHKKNDSDCKAVKTKITYVFSDIKSNELYLQDVIISNVDIVEDLKVNDSTDFKIIKCSDDDCSLLSNNSFICDSNYNYKIILSEIPKKVKIEAFVYKII